MHGREQAQEIILPKPERICDRAWTEEEVGPQQIAALRFYLDDLPEAGKLGRAFARTIVGDTFKASGRDMRRFAKERKAASP